ncbi:MAG: LysR substrate-binding domain-containing protein, partial [Pusillimonas sp.]
MNLQQFRFVRETIRRNFNLTEAARTLFTSQPGVSKSIIELEDELGIKIFERHGKRIRGLTKPGAAVAQVVERIMREVDNLKKVSDEFAQRDEGGLVIGCTHAQARYLLPQVIPGFRAQFPKVRVSLAEGNPTTLARMVLHEQADLAIATESLAHTPGLAALPVYEWEHVLVVKPDHPLTGLTSSQARSLSLEQLAQYPIVTYDRQFSGRRTIDEVFAQKGIQPDIVLEAIDADVIKTYVDVGLGVGI